MYIVVNLSPGFIFNSFILSDLRFEDLTTTTTYRLHTTTC